jgi:hypothetical protein
MLGACYIIIPSIQRIKTYYAIKAINSTAILALRESPSKISAIVFWLALSITNHEFVRYCPKLIPSKTFKQ